MLELELKVGARGYKRRGDGFVVGGQNGPAPGVPLRKLNNVLTSLISICFN